MASLGIGPGGGGGGGANRPASLHSSGTWGMRSPPRREQARQQQQMEDAWHSHQQQPHHLPRALFRDGHQQQHSSSSATSAMLFTDRASAPAAPMHAPRQSGSSAPSSVAADDSRVSHGLKPLFTFDHRTMHSHSDALQRPASAPSAMPAAPGYHAHPAGSMTPPFRVMTDPRGASAAVAPPPHASGSGGTPTIDAMVRAARASSNTPSRVAADDGNPGPEGADSSAGLGAMQQLQRQLAMQMTENERQNTALEQALRMMLEERAARAAAEQAAAAERLRAEALAAELASSSRHATREVDAPPPQPSVGGGSFADSLQQLLETLATTRMLLSESEAVSRRQLRKLYVMESESVDRNWLHDRWSATRLQLVAWSQAYLGGIAVDAHVAAKADLRLEIAEMRRAHHEQRSDDAAHADFESYLLEELHVALETLEVTRRHWLLERERREWACEVIAPHKDAVTRANTVVLVDALRAQDVVVANLKAEVDDLQSRVLRSGGSTAADPRSPVSGLPPLAPPLQQQREEQPFRRLDGADSAAVVEEEEVVATGSSRSAAPLDARDYAGGEDEHDEVLDEAELLQKLERSRAMAVATSSPERPARQVTAGGGPSSLLAAGAVSPSAMSREQLLDLAAELLEHNANLADALVALRPPPADADAAEENFEHHRHQEPIIRSSSPPDPRGGPEGSPTASTAAADAQPAVPAGASPSHHHGESTTLETRRPVDDDGSPRRLEACFLDDVESPDSPRRSAPQKAASSSPQDNSTTNHDVSPAHRASSSGADAAGAASPAFERTPPAVARQPIEQQEEEALAADSPPPAARRYDDADHDDDRLLPALGQQRAVAGGGDVSPSTDRHDVLPRQDPPAGSGGDGRSPSRDSYEAADEHENEEDGGSTPSQDADVDGKWTPPPEPAPPPAVMPIPASSPPAAADGTAEALRSPVATGGHLPSVSSEREGVVSPSTARSGSGGPPQKQSSVSPASRMSGSRSPVAQPGDARDDEEEREDALRSPSGDPNKVAPHSHGGDRDFARGFTPPGQRPPAVGADDAARNRRMQHHHQPPREEDASPAFLRDPAYDYLDDYGGDETP